MVDIDLTLARNWVYVICTVIQTIIAIVGLVLVSFWWDKIKIKDARKRADRQRREEERQKEIQREEDRQRADAEKIAAILSTNYYEVENVFHELKKTVDKFSEEKIVDNWTKFHALLYMCRPENWEKCNKRPIDLNAFIQHGLREIQVTEIHETDLRDKLLSDVEVIMKFFLKCRIELFSIMQNKACPDDIKLEFSRNIIEMGKIIYPFLEKHRQDVIERVLKYFANTVNTQGQDVQNGAANVQELSNSRVPRSSFFLRPCMSMQDVSICCGRQETDGDDNIEMLPRASTSSIESLNADVPELIDYPGNAVIDHAIPYIKCFQYDETGMELNFWLNMHPTILRLLEQVKLGEMQRKENEILQKIHELWQLCGYEPPGGGLLHSVRMIMFKRSENPDFFERHFDEFEQYVQTIVWHNPSDDAKILMCKRMLDNIKWSTLNLRNRKSLLVLPETHAMLESVKSQLEQICSGGDELPHQQQYLQQHYS